MKVSSFFALGDSRGVWVNPEFVSYVNTWVIPNPDSEHVVVGVHNHEVNLFDYHEFSDVKQSLLTIH